MKPWRVQGWPWWQLPNFLCMIELFIRLNLYISYLPLCIWDYDWDHDQEDLILKRYPKIIQTIRRHHALLLIFCLPFLHLLPSLVSSALLRLPLCLSEEFWWRSCFGRLAVKNVLVSVSANNAAQWADKVINGTLGNQDTWTAHTHMDTHRHTGMCTPSGEFCLLFKPKGRKGGHLSPRDAFTRLWPSNFLKSNIFLWATTNLCCTEIRFITTVISPSIILTSIPTFNPFSLSPSLEGGWRKKLFSLFCASSAAHVLS